MMRYFSALGLLVIIFLLSACGDPLVEQIQVMRISVKEQISSLERKLDRGELRNAKVLESYITHVKNKRPELTELLNNLAKDGTANSPSLQDFRERFEKTGSTSNTQKTKEIHQELQRLLQATKPAIFNESLLDTVNVVADLSQGTLPRIQSKHKGDKESRTGSELVGNPRYGQWQTSSSGSFWVWYGQYRLMSDLLWGGRPYYYHSWYYNRPWGYYHDYGRDIYSSRHDRSRHQQTARNNDRKVKQYGRQTGRNASSYASGKRSNRQFRPSRASQQARTASRYGQRGSFRGGSSSRGRFRGK